MKVQLKMNSSPMIVINKDDQRSEVSSHGDCGGWQMYDTQKHCSSCSTLQHTNVIAMTWFSLLPFHSHLLFTEHQRGWELHALVQHLTVHDRIYKKLGHPHNQSFTCWLLSFTESCLKLLSKSIIKNPTCIWCRSSPGTVQLSRHADHRSCVLSVRTDTLI